MEKPYIVSARKYRPDTFESVVGQLHITRTLDNAIASDQLAQALLFCGPRGVGKTTCARILARKINEHFGDPGEDYSLNIFELDAASNNSVDDIRNLIDQVRFAPQTGRFKVYIIDEVHMLSQAAFNAFLKTLEEPPKHAIFILATTEKHKIIPTILSRCQIFDFKRITVDDIARHLAWVAEQEGIATEMEALQLIAQKADGALRDSLSIFDRIVSFSNRNITYQSVIDNLSILDYDYYFRAVDLILNGDMRGLLLLFREILEKGFEAQRFIAGLSAHFRDLLVSKDPETAVLLEVGDSIREKYLDQSRRCNLHFLMACLKLTADCDQNYKLSNNQRLHVEICLLQLADLTRASEEKKKPNNSPELNSSEPRVETGQAVQVPPDVSVKSQSLTAPNPEPKVAVKPVETETLKETQPVKSDPIPAQKDPAADTRKDTPKRRSRLGDLSVRALISEVHEPGKGKEIESGESNAEETNDGLPSEVFSDADFKRVWEAYLEKINHRKSIYNTLSRNFPKRVESNVMELSLDNKTQEGYLRNERTELLAFLRSELKNYKLDIRILVAEKEEVKSLYTAEEKYRHMLEKNPLIEDFRRKLNLDLE